MTYFKNPRSFEGIRQFNKDAADPNKPQQFTFKNKEIARRAGLRSAEVLRARRDKIVKPDASLAGKMRYARKAILEGKVPKNSHLKVIVDTLNSYEAIGTGYMLLMEDLLARVGDLPTERDQFSALVQIAKLHEPMLKVAEARTDKILHKIPVDQINAMIVTAREKFSPFNADGTRNENAPESVKALFNKPNVNATKDE